MSKNPLGNVTEYGREYDPGLLFAVPRSEARQLLGLGKKLPFSGIDLWNAWELTWLDPDGKPLVATAEFRVAADSDNIIESKSLKLYLNTFAMTRFADANAVMRILSTDLSATAGANVDVDITSAASWSEQGITEFSGTCLDELNISCAYGGVNPSLLQTREGEVEFDELYSHLLRSNCPVTNQPDIGSIFIRYSGTRIDEAGLLQYLVSYREHNGFHEACVENIFVDILHRCRPERLTVYARYNRRGGLDINPFRSNFESCSGNCRLWRQ